MKVSKEFLNDYIDISNIDFKEIADKMVFLGNEYDSISKLSSATNLVVGHVLSKEKHENADTLNVCIVDVKEEKLQIVCGAPNVDKDQKVIVAKVGATLPGDFKIKKTKIRGVESNVMICSLEELGIDKKFINEEELKGIHVLKNDAKIGEDALTYLGFNDEIIDFDLTSNRADLLSMLGMAYEVGALYNLDVKYPDKDVKEIDLKSKVNLSVNTENCKYMVLKEVNNIEIKESPDFIKRRLIKSGMRPINNVVDISNYVMLETGQPLHFFDRDKLKNNLEVRMATDNEEIITLDNNKRTLKSEDIVITDGINPISLAGVMGGLSTEVTKDTKNILIECAIFNPKNIRNTSKRTLRSEASLRYEKGISKERTLLASKRAAYLLNKYANGDVLTGNIIYDNTEEKNVNIKITNKDASKLLGLNLSEKDIEEVFKKLKFSYTKEKDTYKVEIPNRRLDLEIKEDLIEEIGRLIGYDKIEGSLPTGSIKEGTVKPKDRLIKKLKNKLENFGLSEVITYSLINEKMSKQFITENKKLVKLKDPISKDKSIMRNSLVPSLIEVYKYNKVRNITDVNIYEIGSRYYEENNKYCEIPTLSALLSGTYFENKWQKVNIKVDFYLVKAVMENILNYSGLNGRYSFVKSNLKELHPGRSADILIGNENIGYLGQVHPDINKDEIYVFNIDIEKILKQKIRPIKNKEIAKYPEVNKDVAFVVKKDVLSESIVKIIKKTGKPLLDKVEVFDIYEGNNLKEDEKSIAYSLSFRDQDKTLTDDEVMVVFNNIIKEVETKLNAKLRDN